MPHETAARSQLTILQNMFASSPLRMGNGLLSVKPEPSVKYLSITMSDGDFYVALDGALRAALDDELPTPGDDEPPTPDNSCGCTRPPTT